MSAQPCSPIISMALRCSPADRYISAAARGSLLLLAQSACLVISIRELFGSVAPTNSCSKKDKVTNVGNSVIKTKNNQLMWDLRVNKRKFLTVIWKGSRKGRAQGGRTMWVKCETGGSESHKQQAATRPFPPVSILPKTNSRRDQMATQPHKYTAATSNTHTIWYKLEHKYTWTSRGRVICSTTMWMQRWWSKVGEPHVNIIKLEFVSAPTDPLIKVLMQKQTLYFICAPFQSVTTCSLCGTAIRVQKSVMHVQIRWYMWRFWWYMRRWKTDSKDGGGGCCLNTVQGLNLA